MYTRIPTNAVFRRVFLAAYLLACVMLSMMQIKGMDEKMHAVFPLAVALILSGFVFSLTSELRRRPIDELCASEFLLLYAGTVFAPIMFIIAGLKQMTLIGFRDVWPVIAIMVIMLIAGLIYASIESNSDY